MLKQFQRIELEKLKELDTLVINSLRYEPHPSHLNIEEALDIVNSINPKKHISLILVIIWVFIKKFVINFQNL